MTFNAICSEDKYVLQYVALKRETTWYKCNLSRSNVKLTKLFIVEDGTSWNSLWSSSSWSSCLWFSCSLASDRHWVLALIHHSVCDYMCFAVTVHRCGTGSLCGLNICLLFKAASEWRVRLRATKTDLITLGFFAVHSQADILMLIFFIVIPALWPSKDNLYRFYFTRIAVVVSYGTVDLPMQYFCYGFSSFVHSFLFRLCCVLLSFHVILTLSDVFGWVCPRYVAFLGIIF